MGMGVIKGLFCYKNIDFFLKLYGDFREVYRIKKIMNRWYCLLVWLYCREEIISVKVGEMLVNYIGLGNVCI